MTGRRTASLILTGTLVLAACGGGSDGTADTASETPPDTAVEATAATTTPPITEDPATSDAPMTTESPMSRDALVAVSRCLDEVPTSALLADYIRLGEFDVIETAKAACDEASVQVGVETAATAAELNEPVGHLNVQLAFLALATFKPGEDVTDTLSFIDGTTGDIADLIGEHRITLPVTDPPVLVP